MSRLDLEHVTSYTSNSSSTTYSNQNYPVATSKGIQQSIYMDTQKQKHLNKEQRLNSQPSVPLPSYHHHSHRSTQNYSNKSYNNTMLLTTSNNLLLLCLIFCILRAFPSYVFQKPKKRYVYE